MSTETEGQKHMQATRLGYFRIPVDLINASFSDAKAAMTGMVVLSAESRDNIIHYVALHDSFASVSPGERIPEYQCHMTRHPDGVSVRWQLVTTGTPNGREVNWED